MRTGACLRMVLYAEGRFVFQADAFYGVVVQVDVGDDGIGRIAHIVRVHTKTVVLGGDLTLPVTRFLTGWLAPRWPLCIL